jgi:hypothetical protein
MAATIRAVEMEIMIKTLNDFIISFLMIFQSGLHEGQAEWAISDVVRSSTNQLVVRSSTNQLRFSSSLGLRPEPTHPLIKYKVEVAMKWISQRGNQTLE